MSYGAPGGIWSPSCAEGPGAADDEEENVFTRMLRSIFIAEVISGLKENLGSLGMKDLDYYLSPSALATFLPPAATATAICGFVVRACHVLSL